MNNYELYKKKLDELYGKSNKIETNEKTISSKDLSWWEQFGAGYERIRNNIVQGALDLGEGIVDTGAGVLAFGAEVFGNPVMEKEIEKFIKTDFTKQVMESDFGDFMGNVTGDWLFGKKAKELAISQERFLPEVAGVSLDDIATGVGNALGTAGLALIPGVGQLAVFSGFTGTGIEEALNQGATISEAMTYGALNGATEMITERVLGDVLGLAGLGLNKAFGVGTSKALTKGGASAVKNIFKGMTEEGLEEVVSELVNPIWQMLTYKSETEGDFLEKYGKIFEENGGMQSVIESFIAGGLTGGVFEGVSTAKGISRYGSLQNYNLELETQQLYEINRNLENALAEGDEKKYQKYQNQKQAVINRSLTKFENLLNQLQSESNGGNEKRLKNKRNLANSFADESLSKPELELAKKILGKNVDVEITGSKDSETQVQKAIVKLSKGQIGVKDYVKTILHEGGHLVDAGKGKFVETILNGMSDETYKEMWEALEPKYKEEIMQSNMLKREMNNNPGLTAEEAYERIKKKYLDEEIAVEYFGTMFKNSKEFMNDIKAYTSKGLKGLKEKFRLFFRGKVKPDNYKELMELFDKGIKEADARAVKRLEAEKKKERVESLPNDEEDVRHRIVETDADGIKTIEIEDKLGIFKNEDGSYMSPYEIRKKILSIVKEHIGSYYNADVGVDLTITTTTANEMGYADESTKIRNLSKRELARKANTILNIEQIINQSVLVGEKTKTGVKLPAYVFKINILLNSNKIPVYLLVQPKDTKLLLYDLFLKNYSYKSLNENEKAERKGVIRSKMTIDIRAVSSTESIARDTDDVKGDIRKRITKSDSEGNELSPKQQEYFNDSVVRDENGNLLVVYHGTTNDFTVFDKELSNNAFFFTDDKLTAMSYYGFNSAQGKTMNLYLNITNPRVIDVSNSWDKIDIGKTKKEHYTDYEGIRKLINEIKTLEELTIISNAITAYDFDTIPFESIIAEDMENGLSEQEIFQKYYNAEEMINYLEENELQDVVFAVGNINRYSTDIKDVPDYSNTRTLVEETLKSGEYDGIIFKNIFDYGGALPTNFSKATTVYVAFEPNQIKAVTNTDPTLDEDIRYRKTDSQEEYFNDLLLENSELSKLQKRIAEIMDKYESEDSPAKRSKIALDCLEKLRTKNEILLGYYEELVGDLNEAIDDKDKNKFDNTLAELKVLTEVIQSLQEEADDMNYNIDTTGDYDKELSDKVQSAFDDRIEAGDEINSEISDSFSDVEINLDEYDEGFVKETFPEPISKPIPEKMKERFLKNIEPYSNAKGFKEMVEKINNATVDSNIVREVAEFVKKSQSQNPLDIAIRESDELIEVVRELIEKVNYSPNPKITIEAIKEKGNSIIKALQASYSVDLEKVNANYERLKQYEEKVHSYIKEEKAEQPKVETAPKPVEEKKAETPTETAPTVDQAKIKEITEKYNALNKIPFDSEKTVAQVKQDVRKRYKNRKKLSSLRADREKTAKCISIIRDVKNKYLNELTDLGLSIEEAKSIAKELFEYKLLGEKGQDGTSLRQMIVEIDKLIADSEEKVEEGNDNTERVIAPAEQSTVATETVVEKVIKYIPRTKVRKQPTPSAQTVNLYADFITDPDARVYAQQRGVDLLTTLTNELNNGLWGTKKYKPRLFFKNGREFVINKIHMILNKFSNAQYTKSGEDLFDYSNLTKEEQIDMIVKEIMKGIQILSKEFVINEKTGLPNSEGEEIYQYITENDRAYSVISEFLANQLDILMTTTGNTPKIVELMNKETAKFKEELAIKNKVLSDKELQVKAYETAVKELRGEISLLNKALLNAQKSKNPNLKVIQELQEKIEKRNQQILKIKERLEGRLANLTEQNKGLKASYNEVLKNTKDLEKKATELSKIVSKLNTRVERAEAKNKELKAVANNTARQVNKLKKVEEKYANQIIFESSKLERGRELPKNMVEVLTEVGKQINPEFKISSKVSIEIGKLLIKKEYHDAFNLMINAVLDSNFEVEDGFVDYHELVDMYNVDDTNYFLASMNEMEQWFNNFVATGKFTKVEKLYYKIERITDAYLKIKERYNAKRAELAVYRGARTAVATTQRINRRLKKLKSEKRFGGVKQELVDWIFESYDKIKALKLKDIQNGDYRTLAQEIISKYESLSLPEELQMDVEIINQADDFINGDINNKNVKAYTKFLNQLNRYVKDITGQALYTIDGVTKTRKEWATEIYDNLNDTVGSGKVKWHRLLNYSIDPRVVFKMLGGMDENSPVYKLYKMLNQAEIRFQQIMIDLGQNIRDFYKTNKKFMKELGSKKTVNIGGYTATRGEFLSLYKLMQREQAKKHLINASGGINLNGEIIRGWTEESIEQLQNDIIEFFDLNNENSTYKKYIDLTTEFFDNAKDLKVSTDMELMGYTNVEDGEYFPIQITNEDLYSNLDNHNLQFRGIMGALDMSFNKNVVSSSKAIKVGNIDDIMTRHMRQMATYSAYAIPIHTFNKIYNYRFALSGEESKGALNGINPLMENKAEGFEEYIKTLFMDIQGINPNRNADENMISKVFGWARGNFAKFQLGANIKVIFSQVSALGNALKYIKLKNIVRGIGSKLHIDSGKYALPTVGVYRNMTNTISTAQMQQEHKGGFWTKGIEWADQMCIRSIWRSCLLQTGMDVEKATEMFNKTVQETQPNYTPLQRSAMMRSKSEVMKALTMFGNQPSKNFSNIVEAVMTISYKKKNGIKITSEDMNFVRKTVFESVLWSSAIYSVVSVIFSHLTNNDWDDEPEEYASELFERLANDAFLGNIPILGNTVDFDLRNGKLFKINELDMSNSVGIFNSLLSLVQGNQNPKEMVDTIALLFGIPTANAYKYLMMFVQWIAPQYATQVELMYKGVDLTTTQAVKNTQSHKTKNYYYAYTTNTVSLNQKTMDELYRLYRKDDNVILKAIPKSITLDGETMTIKRSDFKTYYNKIAPTLESVISDTAYQKLTDEQKALVLKNLINKYHSMSKKQFTEADMNSLEYLISSGYNNLSKDLIYLGQIKQLESKQEIQKFINKLPLKASQKYLLYYLSGYSISDTQQKTVMTYLKSKGVNPKQANTFFDI